MSKKGSTSARNKAREHDDDDEAVLKPVFSEEEEEGPSDNEEASHKGDANALPAKTKDKSAGKSKGDRRKKDDESAEDEDEKEMTKKDANGGSSSSKKRKSPEKPDNEGDKPLVDDAVASSSSSSKEEKAKRPRTSSDASRSGDRKVVVFDRSHDKTTESKNRTIYDPNKVNFNNAPVLVAQLMNERVYAKYGVNVKLTPTALPWINALLNGVTRTIITGAENFSKQNARSNKTVREMRSNMHVLKLREIRSSTRISVPGELFNTFESVRFSTGDVKKASA